MNTEEKLYIGVDFDGTLVSEAFPLIGRDIGGFKVMREMQRRGCAIILMTCRAGIYLDQAVSHCWANGLEFDGINKTTDDPMWNSPSGPVPVGSKPQVHIYIGNEALGCPLVPDEQQPGRVHVDWGMVKEMLDVIVPVPTTIVIPRLTKGKVAPVGEIDLGLGGRVAASFRPGKKKQL